MIKNKYIIFLKCLRKNARITLTNASKKTNIPISTLFDILKQLRKEIIIKHTSLLNFQKLGYHCKAHVFLRVQQENKEELKQHLLIHEAVNNIYKINNSWNFIIETIHEDVIKLDDFLEKLEQRFKIEKKEIHYIIEDIKREGFLAS